MNRFSPLVITLLLCTAFAVAANIGVSATSPVIERSPDTFTYFPDEGKIPHSEQFIATRFLGYDFLDSAFTTRYDVKEYMFIIPAISATRVHQVSDLYLQALSLPPDTTGAAILDVTDPQHGSVALLRYGNFLAGVVGARDRESSHWRLGLLKARITDLQRAAVRVDLPRQWHVLMAEAPNASSPEFDDAGWRSMDVACYWETQGFDKYDGVAWYRTSSVIPSALRRASIGDALQISLGRIDDNDSVYVNGIKVGHTENASAIRRYFVPFEVIRWDRPNTIAVRIDDIGGGGGMVAGPYYIKATGTPDLVRITAGEAPVELDSTTGDRVTRSVRLACLRPVTVSGQLGIKVVNLNTHSILWDSTWHCTTDNLAGTAHTFALTIPATGSYRALYSFTADSSRDTVRSSAVIVHRASARQACGPATPVVRPLVADKALAIPLENVRLKGYLEDRMRANLEHRLLKVDEAGVLAGYLDRPGDQDWVNEYVGKYLHAAALTWRYTHDPALRVQMDRIVDVLLTCQKDDGYLGTYLPENYWLSWDVWGHKYNMTGLLSYYKITGYVPALEASKRMGDLLCRTFGREQGKKDLVRSGAWFGLASCSVLDPMVELYSMTGDTKYLNFCRYIIDAYDHPDGPQVVSKLLADGKVEKIAGGKAYELLSNLLGITKLYRITGDEKLWNAVDIAWTAIARSRLYVTGSASSYEIFHEDGVLPAGADAFIGEGCVTTEWLHLNEELFRLTGDARYMDAMETTVYNHLLAAENPLDGGVSYYTPLQGKRNFRSDIFGNCCLASVPRGIAVIPEIIYARRADSGLSINIYAAGTAECSVATHGGKDVAVHCSIDTRFPENGNVQITIDPTARSRFPVALRVPSWCARYAATAGGKTYRGHPGGYVLIDRTWEKGSVIRVACDLTTRILQGGKSYSACVAVQRGPQVLALDAGLNAVVESPDSIRLDPQRVRVAAARPPDMETRFGKQYYTLTATNEHGRSVPVVLVPFADAGQKRDDVRVWLKRK